MKAETITLHITIRPSYAKAASVKEEIVDSLLWLSDDHDAISLVWGEDGEGEWPDDDDDDRGHDE